MKKRSYKTKHRIKLQKMEQFEKARKRAGAGPGKRVRESLMSDAQLDRFISAMRQAIRAEYNDPTLEAHPQYRAYLKTKKS